MVACAAEDLKGPKMLSKHCQTIATIIVAALLTTGACAADSAENGPARNDPARPKAAEMNRALARQANKAAVEDAVEAVLYANRQHLDFLINGRTSRKTSEEATDGR